ADSKDEGPTTQVVLSRLSSFCFVFWSCACPLPVSRHFVPHFRHVCCNAVRRRLEREHHPPLAAGVEQIRVAGVGDQVSCLSPCRLLLLEVHAVTQPDLAHLGLAASHADEV